MPRSPSPRWSVCLAAALAAGLALPPAARAQEATAGVTVLKPEAVEGLEQSKMAGERNTTAADPRRYSIQDLDIMQPVAVRVEAEDPARPIRIEVVKGEWDQVYRDQTTGADGAAEVRFRTQGACGLKVTSPTGAGAGYRLALWVGDEIKTVPANVLVPREGGAGGSNRGGFTDLLLGFIAAALVVLIALVAWSMFRKRSQGASS